MKLKITNATIVGEISEGLTIDGIRNLLKKTADKEDNKLKSDIKKSGTVSGEKYMGSLVDKSRVEPVKTYI